ncbi:MAG: hypothetical protein ABSE46_25435 [Terracidiphilus sp.]
MSCRAGTRAGWSKVLLIDDDGIHSPHAIEAGVLLDAGRHTIHLPYFQGPMYVNLILKVQPPVEN